MALSQGLGEGVPTAVLRRGKKTRLCEGADPNRRGRRRRREKGKKEPQDADPDSTPGDPWWRGKKKREPAERPGPRSREIFRKKRVRLYALSRKGRDKLHLRFPMFVLILQKCKRKRGEIVACPTLLVGPVSIRPRRAGKKKEKGREKPSVPRPVQRHSSKLAEKSLRAATSLVPGKKKRGSPPLERACPLERGE